MTQNPNSVAGRALDRADARVRQDEGLGGRAARLHRPGALGRPRHAAGGRRPRRHLGRLHLAQPGLPAARQPGRTCSSTAPPPASSRSASSACCCSARSTSRSARCRASPRRSSACSGSTTAGRWPARSSWRSALGAAVGALYATLFNRVGMPSFVATLAGLLALLGLQLYLLGTTGSINLPFALPLVRFGQNLYMPNWLSLVLALIPGAVVLWTGLPGAGAAAGGGPHRRRDERPGGQGAGADRRLWWWSCLPRPRARRAVDVRPLRAPRRGRWTTPSPAPSGAAR